MTKDAISENLEQWLREDPAIATPGLRFSMWLARAARLQNLRFAAMCKAEFDLLPSEAHLLLALRRSGRPFALRPTDLFKAQLVSSGGMTKQIDRLCEADLVIRNRDPLHAGGYLVQLTAPGLKKADRLIRYLLRAGDPIDLIGKELEQLGSQQAAVLTQFLDRVLAIQERAAMRATARDLSVD
jgi:DNA-binding MarR family transcriptional regulator